MNLTSQYENYTIPSTACEGSKKFFHENQAKLWKFENYFEKTHNEIGKSQIREVQFIYRNYQNDLLWLENLEVLPSEIKRYVTYLRDNQKFSKSELKQKFCASKETITRHNPITITGSSNIIFSGEGSQHIYYYGDDSKGAKRKNEDQEDSSNNDDNSNKRNCNTEEATGSNIWREWLSFLDAEESSKFHKHSPEKHKVIRCGKNISHLPNLPVDTYKKHVDLHQIEHFPIPFACKDYMDSVIDCSNKESLKKIIKNSPELEVEEDKMAVEFLEEIFLSLYKIYMNNQDLDDNESVFNHLFVYPFLSTVSSACASLLDCKCDFVPGETFLQSMTKQLGTLGQIKDERYQYKADGVFRLFGLKKIEILLLETSGEYNNNDKVKINFDHHKGTFGALAILKTIADLYPYGAVEQFKNIKIFFVHAAGVNLHLWSLCYKEEGIYELWNEESLKIKPDYVDKDDFIPDAINFFWKMKQLIARTITGIYMLKDSHVKTKAKFRYSSFSPPLLTDVVKPSIVKLSQHDDQKGMASLGPFFISNSI